MKRALYFGCRGPREPGHFLQEGRETIWAPPAGCPWDLGLMDGGLLKNGNRPDVEGTVWWTCGGRTVPAMWFAFFWRDYSGDRRSGSNSGFYVTGFPPAEPLTYAGARAAAILAFDHALTSYPWVVARQNNQLVLCHDRP